MWSESSTAHCLFFYLSVNRIIPVLFSCSDNTSSLQAAVFQGKNSYWEGKILLGMPDVWGCSKYSCSISMGIKAVMISVRCKLTCCWQTPRLCPGSHWHRNPSDLFIWCFLIPWPSDWLMWPDLFQACRGNGCRNKQGVSLSPVPSPCATSSGNRLSRRKPTGQSPSQMLTPEHWN